MQQHITLNGHQVPATPTDGMTPTNLNIYLANGTQIRLAMDGVKYLHVINDWLGRLLRGDGVISGGKKLHTLVRSMKVSKEPISAIVLNHDAGTCKLNYTYLINPRVDLPPKHRRYVGSVVTKTAVTDGKVCMLTLVY